MKFGLLCENSKTAGVEVDAGHSAVLVGVFNCLALPLVSRARENVTIKGGINVSFYHVAWANGLFFYGHLFIGFSTKTSYDEEEL